VLVLNDPFGLAHAMNKVYFEQFPAQVRPRTLVTRAPEDVKEFVHDCDERAILKPVQGSGGKNVFRRG
jgi:glutathione synthase